MNTQGARRKWIPTAIGLENKQGWISWLLTTSGVQSLVFKKVSEDVVYIYDGILLGNEKEWNLAIYSNVDGTGGYYAEWNKSVRERQIPYVFTHMWILRNLTEDHEGREREKSYKQRRREANHKRLWDTENSNWGLMGSGGEGESRWWAFRRAFVGMSTGCCT